MKIFKEDTPIYLQLRQHIEEMILNKVLCEEELIPSVRAMARDYSINPLTVTSAIHSLAEEGVLYKKRGVGIFVSPNARELIIKSRSKSFVTETLEPIILRAHRLEIPKQQIINRLNAIYGDES